MDDLNCTLNPMKQRCLQWLLCFLLVIPYNNLFICLYLFACFRFISFFWHFRRTVLPFHAVTLNFQCYRRFKVMCFIFLTTLFWAALWNHMICSYSSIHIPRWHICGSREYHLTYFVFSCGRHTRRGHVYSSPNTIVSIRFGSNHISLYFYTLFCKPQCSFFPG